MQLIGQTAALQKLEDFVVNFFLNIYQARECLRTSAISMRIIETAGVAGWLGFGERVL